MVASIGRSGTDVRTPSRGSSSFRQFSDFLTSHMNTIVRWAAFLASMHLEFHPYSRKASRCFSILRSVKTMLRIPTASPLGTGEAGTGC